MSLPVRLMTFNVLNRLSFSHLLETFFLKTIAFLKITRGFYRCISCHGIKCENIISLFTTDPYFMHSTKNPLTLQHTLVYSKIKYCYSIIIFPSACYLAFDWSQISLNTSNLIIFFIFIDLTIISFESFSGGYTSWVLYNQMALGTWNISNKLNQPSDYGRGN